MGKLFITAELGGGGTSHTHTMRIARRGGLNVLRHAGIVAGAVETSPMQWLDMPSRDCFSFAEDNGMIETMVDLGEPVEEDKVLARIHSVGRTGIASQEIRAKMSGLLAARHFLGLVKAGECAAVVVGSLMIPRGILCLASFAEPSDVAERSRMASRVDIA